jgi:hypothetical protein
LTCTSLNCILGCLPVTPRNFLLLGVFLKNKGTKMARNSEIKNCPACSMKFTDGIPTPSWGQTIPKQELKERICKYAKGKGCINNYVELS